MSFKTWNALFSGYIKKYNEYREMGVNILENHL